MGDDASVNVVRRYFCFSASWISSRFCCCLARSEEALLLLAFQALQVLGRSWEGLG